MANGPFNVLQGDAGYQDVIECANTVSTVRCLQIVWTQFCSSGFKFSINVITILQLLKMRPEEVLIESTGVIGQRIKKVDSSALCMSYMLC